MGPPIDAPAPSDPNATVYDNDTEHKIIACDIRNGSVVVFDLNKCSTWSDLTKRKCKVWEWKAKNEKTCQYPDKVGRGIDEGKLRYSEYYKTDVVLATSSAGWAAVISYPKGKVLWEALVPYGPHSMEMLPNGDVVVASSGGSSWNKNGTLFYYPLSSGSTDVSCALNFPSAHGLSWDPEQNILWALGMNGIAGVRVINAGTAQGRLEFVEGKTASFRDSSGHDLSPVYGQPGKYWVTGTNSLWLFDSKAMTMTKQVDWHTQYTAKEIKGVAYFPDGTMVHVQANMDNKATTDFSSTLLSVITVSAKADDPATLQAVRRDIRFTNREFYKVHTFCRDYQ